MSAYQYDLIRTNKEFAKQIIDSIDEEFQNCNILLCTKMKDDSVVLEWATWHGSPFPDFERLLNKDNQWLYAVEYDDGTAEIQDQYAKEEWKSSYEIVDNDGTEMVDIKEFGIEIKTEELQ